MCIKNKCVPLGSSPFVTLATRWAISNSEYMPRCAVTLQRPTPPAKAELQTSVHEAPGTPSVHSAGAYASTCFALQVCLRGLRVPTRQGSGGPIEG